MSVNFIKKDGDVAYFNGDGELVYFVPEKYFDLGVATIFGEYVDLLGVFNYGLFSKDGKVIKIKQFTLPSMFRCKPTEITKEKEYILKGTTEAKDYRLLHFKKGSEAISSTRIPKSVSNIEIFMNLFTKGNLVKAPYDKIQDLIILNAELNDRNYGLSAQCIGIMISELCRDPKNVRSAFRLSSMDDMNSYIPSNLIAIPKYVSAYSAITSENADEAIANAMIDVGGPASPMEKVMMS